MKSLLLLVLAAVAAFGQPMLTCENAIEIALKNNYDILIAHNDADIAKVNNTLGNAGVLPTAAITGSDNYSLNNIDQKLPGKVSDTAYNSQSNSLNIGAVFNWTLFDGGKMFVTKRKLGEIEALGGVQYKDRVLQTIYNVTIAYYDVVRQKQQLASFNDVIAYNQERVTIFQTSFDAGLSPKTNILQAKIDLNVNKESAMRQKTVITQAKRTLNLLLGRDANTLFEVADSIPNTFTPDRSKLLERINTSNTSILELQKQLSIAKMTVEETGTLGLPKLSVSGGYSFSQGDNTAGSVLTNRANGPMIGAAVSIPLYQAGNVVRQISTAKLQLKSTEIELDNVKLQINILLQNTFDDFENQLQLLSIEKDNVTLAKENLDISLARLKQGQSTSLELKLAEQSYEDALTRLISIQFNCKAAETKLKQLLNLF